MHSNLGFVPSGVFLLLLGRVGARGGGSGGLGLESMDMRSHSSSLESSLSICLPDARWFCPRMNCKFEMRITILIPPRFLVRICYSQFAHNETMR